MTATPTPTRTDSVVDMVTDVRADIDSLPDAKCVTCDSPATHILAHSGSCPAFICATHAEVSDRRRVQALTNPNAGLFCATCRMRPVPPTPITIRPI